MPEVVVNADGTEQAAKFQYDFVLEGKALEATPTEDGDLIVEGYAADFSVDRDNEAFTENAFERGLQKYLSTNPILCYHHKFDRALGQVLDASIDSKGMKIRARIDKPSTGSWAEDVFNKIRKGTIRAFSVGGIFRRKLTEGGWRIHDVDLAEISVTPISINPNTTFAVVAGKAFANAPDATDDPELNEAYSKFSESLDRFATTLDRFEKS